MQGKFFAALAVAAAFGLASPASADVSAFGGHWNNVDPATTSIVTVDMTIRGGGALYVHPWGACTPTPCDWGMKLTTPTVPGVAYTVTYNQGFAVKKLGITIIAGGKLQIVTNVVFTDNSGRAPYQKTDVFTH